MKRIKTRALALLLSCCLVAVGTIGSYQTTQAAEIVAGGALVGTLEEILLSFGLFLLPSSMIDSAHNPDWWYSEDGNAALKPYYEDLATEYEKERFKVINGGGNKPQPSPTPEPGTTPEVTPVPTGDIPTFDELVAPALAGGAIAWANGAFDVMGKAVGNLWDKICGTVSSDMDGIPEDIVNQIVSSGYPYYLYSVMEDYLGNDVIRLGFYGVGSYMYGNDLRAFGYKEYENGKLYKENPNGGLDRSNLKSLSSVWASNLPVFSTNKEGNIWSEQQRSNKDKYTKENIWVHPDLQETYQNNGKFEYPSQAPHSQAQ